MKASELRIGNLVFINEIEQIDNTEFLPLINPLFEVQSIDVDLEVVVYSEIETIHIYTDTENIEPIPLTEEWLLKFSFEKTLNQYRKPTLLNKIGYNNIPFIILFLDNQYQYDDLIFRTNIEYVHQLQNLYFALTGEELTLITK